MELSKLIIYRVFYQEFLETVFSKIFIFLYSDASQNRTNKEEGTISQWNASEHKFL